MKKKALKKKIALRAQKRQKKNWKKDVFSQKFFFLSGETGGNF